MSQRSLWLALGASFLERLASSVAATLLTVYLASVGWSVSMAAMTAGVVIGTSYLVSVLAAPRAGDRWATVSAMALLASAFVALAGGGTLVGLGLLPIATGIYRPAITLQLNSRRGRLGTEQVMARYLFLLNLAYLIGPVVADLIRMRVGWQAVFVLCIGAASAASALSVTTAEKVATPPIGTGESSAIQLAAFLTAVAISYGIQQQAVGPLALLCEMESTPLMFLHHQARLHAGGLAGVHGAFVLGGMGLMIFWRRRTRLVLVTSVGLTASALSFALLAFSEYPIRQNALVFAFLLLAVGETLMGPGLLALGARLSGLRRSLYWLAAGLGYWGGGAVSALWEHVSHRIYLLTVGASCLMAALLVLGLALFQRRLTEMTAEKSSR